MTLRGYDTWLEQHYQNLYANEPPREVEDLLDTEFWYDGERAVVESWETWQDADEDGSYGGVDLVIRIGKRTENMSLTRFEEVLANQNEHKGEE